MLSGRHAALAVKRWLAEPHAWPHTAVPVACRAPLGWISPNAVGLGAEAPPRGRFALRASVFVRRPAIEIRQEERVLWRGRLARVQPGRSASLPATWIASVDATGGPIEVGLQAPAP